MNIASFYPGCEILAAEQSEHSVLMHMRTLQRSMPCPSCHWLSSKLHSYYTRSIKDTAFAEHAMFMHLRVRRLYCENSDCQQKTFTERLPQLLAPYARRTFRLQRLQVTIATFLSAEAASRLLATLHMPLSSDRLVDSIRAQTTEDHATPRVLGVDDWAIKKGRSYGTILVDLEKHQVVDLLSDRSSAALELWLKESPGVEIIVRDRAFDYKVGAKAGAPQAVQVADRWHLLRNLREMLERYLGTVISSLRRLPVSPDLQPEIKEITAKQYRSSRPTRAAKEAAKANREKRLALFNEVKALYTSGVSLLAISKKLSMDRKTVRAYAYAECFPERPPRPYTATLLDPYLEHLNKRHAEGCENASQLHREICELGFTGTAWHVLRWMQPRRRKPSKHTPGKRCSQKEQQDDKAEEPVKLSLPSAPQLSWLLLQDEDDQSDEHRVILKHLQQDQALSFMRGHCLAFRKMICQRDAKLLDDWLEVSLHHSISQLRTFAEGLKRDYAEVKAALDLPWSNGQTEGQVNKLKMIKRQMYGRANFDLLRQRVLLSA